MILRTLNDLCAYWQADEPIHLNLRVYKDTDCGASVSILLPDGHWLHNGDTWAGVREIVGFSLQTIIEGTEETVDGATLFLPVSSEDLQQYVQAIEDAAARIFDEIDITGEDG